MRRRIFRIIQKAPGVHVREVERRAGVGYGAVEYHLRRLEQDGLVRAVDSGQLKTYFTTDFPREDRDVAGALRVEPARRLLVALLSFGELAHGDLARASGLGLSTVTHHAKRLVRRGIVRAEQKGRHTIFSLADRRAVERALIRHGHSLGDSALDAYLTVWSEWRRPTARPAPREEEEPPSGP